MAYFPFIHMQVAREDRGGWSSGMEQGMSPAPAGGHQTEPTTPA